MSTSAPVLEGTRLATAAAVEDLQRQVSDLREQVENLKAQARRQELPPQPADWREAMTRLQEGYASMPEEAKQLYEEADAEARAFFRGETDG